MCLTKQFTETAARMLTVKMYMFLTIALLCIIVQPNIIYAKRILVIANVPSYSHQISYRTLCLELNKRGHEIVSVTTDPIKNSSLTNYKEIDLRHIYALFINNPKLDYTSLTHASLVLPFLDVEQNVWIASDIMNYEVFIHPEIKKLYAADSNEHFDAVIVAQGINLAVNAFAHRFKAPLIGISSLDVYNQIRYTSGGLILPSHLSNWQSNMQIEDNMSFWQRLVNFCQVWMQMYIWVNKVTPRQHALAKKYLGPDIPSVLDITSNMSLYLVNKHPMISIVRQELPNVIFYHGFHIVAVPPPLPKELKYLDKMSDGFIYVSLGTNVRWDHMPNNTLEIFTKALDSLPWKVLWKNDPKLIPIKYKNILVLKWFPQQSILAHPKIKLFIFQGGLQSTEEAIYHGVPLIGCPVLWDQKYQVRNIKRLGIGTYLDYKNMSKEMIVNAVHEVINNKSYKERMKEISEIYKNTPYDTLQNAVWWVEYTMNHNGMTGLHDRISNKSWYQRYDWDIISFLVVITLTAFFIFLYVLFQILLFICKHYQIFSRDSQNYIKLKRQ